MNIKTKRLIIREFKKDDQNELIKQINNIHVSQYLLVVPYPYTKKDAQNFIKKCLKDSKINKRTNYELAITLKENDKLIGCINLGKIDFFRGTCMIGYWLGEDY